MAVSLPRHRSLYHCYTSAATRDPLTGDQSNDGGLRYLRSSGGTLATPGLSRATASAAATSRRCTTAAKGTRAGRTSCIDTRAGSIGRASTRGGGGATASSNNDHNISMSGRELRGEQQRTCASLGRDVGTAMSPSNCRPLLTQSPSARWSTPNPSRSNAAAHGCPSSTDWIASSMHGRNSDMLRSPYAFTLRDRASWYAASKQPVYKANASVSNG